MTFFNAIFLILCVSKTSYQPKLLRSHFSGCTTVFIQNIVYNSFRLETCSMIAIVNSGNSAVTGKI